MKGAVSLEDVREVLLGAKYADEHLAMIDRGRQRARLLQSYPNAAVRRSARLLAASYEASAAAVRGRRDRALAVIDAVSDPLDRQILELRFVEGLTLEKVAERINYSYQHLCRKLLPAALAAAQDIVDKGGADSS